MGKFREFFRKNKKKSHPDPREAYLTTFRAKHPPFPNSQASQSAGSFDSPLAIPPPRDFVKQLPPSILADIFARVCVHSQDGSFIPIEDSVYEDVCMLCDLRDLAHCALVCRSWREAAIPLMYTNVRIDPVHYCELEGVLSKLRKRGSFLDRNAIPIDAPLTRLEQLCRTLRNSHDLAHMVRSLRTPYMTRETSIPLLAKTISVCTNLRYADLPQRFYRDHRTCQVLRRELEARCSNLRYMKYAERAEGMFAFQVIRPPTPDGRSGCTWPNLEWLELSELRLDGLTFRAALPNLPMLASLKLVNLAWLDDSCLRPLPGSPNFPAVERLIIVNAPKITWKGLVAALTAAPQIQGQPPPGMKIPVTSQRPALRLQELRVENTGIEPFTIAHILRHMPKIQTFSMIQEDVTKPFPLDSGGETLPIPPLFSSTLKTLHYEVTSPPTPPGIVPAAETYYAYLVSSILAKGFPALREVYVKDNKFPNALLTAPAIAPGTNPRMSLLPAPGFGGNVSAAGDRSSLNMVANPTVDKPLKIYSKDPTELEWNFTAYNPRAARGSRATETRPVSFFGASLGPAWGGESRKSVLVGNGFGGYVAVPVDEEGDKKKRRNTSGWITRSERMDMFR
ncbi:hypothetical protein KEM54_006590 [Ascosphaera aggregata]|nr:hypothetical protein KEM54_006590 [Ascosphaera aggregata]